MATRWRPAPAELNTRWTADVDPEAVLPAYPRPQLRRADWLNLNGLWDYAITGRRAQRPRRWDGEILVPFAVESALSGVARPLLPTDRLWYRTAFSLPSTWDRRRVLVHFGAVDWHTAVFCNDTLVGDHSGGFTPFSVELTDTLTAGDNELVVAVWDPTNTGHQPRGKQTLNRRRVFYSAVSGIWQTVWLEPVPDTHVRGLSITPDVAAAAFDVRVDASRDALTKIELHRGAETIAETTAASNTPVRIDVPAPRLWSPADPHLYDITIRLDDGADTVHSYAGLRSSGLIAEPGEPTRLALNGEPVFEHGPLDQGYWPDGLYTAPSDAALLYDIEVTRELGFNMTRKHIKVEPARWYAHCDRLGLLVWQDMPNGAILPYKRPAWRENFVTELGDMIDALYNVPSIVAWVPFNEGWGQWDTRRITERVRRRDPTRLIDHASGFWDKGAGDIASKHRYPSPGMRGCTDGRAEVCTEYGGFGDVVDGHVWPAKRPWAYRMARGAAGLSGRYLAAMDRVEALVRDGLAGSVYTQLTDVEGEVNGLLTYDRELVKVDVDEIAARNRDLIERYRLRARV